MNSNIGILVALTDRSLAERLASGLKSGGFSCQVVYTDYDCKQSIEKNFFHAAVLDTSLFGNSALGILQKIKLRSPATEVIIVGMSDSPDLAARAVSKGAFICAPKSLSNPSYLEVLVSRALEKQRLERLIKKKSDQLDCLIGAAGGMASGLDMKQLLRRTVKTALLLTGSEQGSVSLIENDRVEEQEFWDGKKWKEKVPFHRPESERTSVKENSEGKSSPLSTVPERENFSPLPRLGSYTSVPVVSEGGDFLGVLEVGGKKEKGEYGKEDIRLLESLARSSAAGINNVRLYKDAKVRYEGFKESERKHRILVERSPDLIFIVDSVGFKYANEKALKTLSAEGQDLQNSNIIDVIAPNCREVFRESVGKAMNGEVVQNYEVTLAGKKLREVVLDVSFVSITYQGRPAAQITARDVTKRKKADEETLRLVAAVKSLNPAVTITDMSGKIAYINPSHKRVFGYKLEELLEKQSSVLYPFDDPYGVGKKIYEAILAVGWEGERVGVRKNGEVFPVYEKTSVVKDKDGKQIGVVSVVEDITLKKRLEQSVKESEERYRTLVETAKSAIIAVDEYDKITLFNPAAEELFGYSTDEISSVELTALIPEKYRESHKAGLTRYRETGIPNLIGKTVELLGLKKNGEEFPIEVSLSACKIGGRKIFTAIVFDITERKNLQDQLIQSEKMAAVGQLISGVAHEINNPLATVMGYAEMFLQDPTPDRQLHKGLQSIYDESNRAKKVIQNLLSFARKHNPDREPTYLNEVIERTLDLKEYDFKKNNIEVVKSLGPDLPPSLMDPNQIQQVFLNILINAEQSLAENLNDRRIWIQTKFKKYPDVKINSANPGGDGALEITFSDNGPGISKKNIKKIFDPFFTTKPVGKGTGLGLSVSYRIIKEHGGEIYALSEENKGATFIVELPMVSIISSIKI